MVVNDDERTVAQIMNIHIAEERKEIKKDDRKEIKKEAKKEAKGDGKEEAKF